MDYKEMTNFPVTLYGKMERFSDTISKGRCRVFYKGRNRNGTYITDEFAQKLVDSAPYTPIKGIYSQEGNGFSDHGKERTEGRIYGVVAADPNFAWEQHQDCDGITRTYACFDVLYYTALYEEAGQIDGSAQSMELYRKTLKGSWRRMADGRDAYVFTDGCFLGLQVLGEEVEPCFEGASFYTCENNILSLLDKYEKKLSNFENKGGDVVVENFEEVVETAAEVTEETTQVETEIETAADPAAITEVEPESETVETENAPNEYELRIAELENSIAALTAEKETLVSERDAAISERDMIQSEYTAVVAERDELATFKKNVEDAEKKALIATYESQLSEDVVEQFTSNLDRYSLADLDKELVYAVAKAHPNLFTATEPAAEPAALLPKDGEVRGIESILAKYEKRD